MTNPTLTYAWAPITKTETADDGTITVYGPAASSALDRDQQRLSDAWLDTAMPRWMAEGGGVREQHDPKRAVGVGVGLSKGDDGAHYLTARIVDPIAIKKIEHGVLRGFSVGIKNPRVEMGKADAPKGLVVGGDVIEVSVCDRPSNPGTLFAIAKADAAGDLAAVADPQLIETDMPAHRFGLPGELYERLAAPVKEALASLAEAGASVTATTAAATKADDESMDMPAPVVNVTVAVEATPTAVTVDADVALNKADYSAADRKRMAKAKQAMTDGSYPIKTKADLRNAIRAVGRGGADHDAIRKHIITRAKALGQEDMVPTNWNSDGSEKTSTKADEAVIEPDTDSTAEPGVEEGAAKADDGPPSEPAVVDAARAALAATGERILRDTRALLPATVKADDGDGSEQGDIDGANAAIAAIAALIISEAESLAQGNLNEACDIAILLQAVDALKYFTWREQAEQDPMELADTPDLTKAATKKSGNLAPPFAKKKAKAGDAGGEDDASTGDDEDDEDDDKKKNASPKKTSTKTDDTGAEQDPDTEVLTKADVADLIKTAVAQATTSQERVSALEVELAKANTAIEGFRNLPTPGGPVLTRTAAQQAEARKADGAQLRAQADELLAKAKKYEGSPALALGYKDRARELLTKADA